MTEASNDKAYLILKEPSADGGKNQIGDPFKLQFNPKELTVSKSASWNFKAGKTFKEAPTPEFKGAVPRSLSVEIFLDAVGPPKRDLVKDIEQLFKLCTPEHTTLNKNVPCPPFVTFGWGTTIQMEAYVEKVDVKYTLFKQDGTPIRAIATIALKEVPRTSPPQNPTSGALSAQRTHTVVEGDSLASIAYREYGNPNLWRAVADANKIDDPMRLRAGSSLLLPAIEDAGEPVSN